MPVTADTAQRVALETLGFDEFPAHIPGLMLANQAGDWLFSTRSWNFLDGAEVNLDTVAGESFISLPGDFQAVIELTRASSGSTPANWITWTTVAEIVRLRGTLQSVGTLAYYGAVGYRDDGAGTPTPVLELYPAPTTNESGAFRLRYRRQWRALTEDTDRTATPGWIDALYLEAVRSFARGLMEEDQGSLSARLGELTAGALYMTAVRRDTTIQSRHGILSGGAARWRGHRRFNPNIEIANP